MYAKEEHAGYEVNVIRSKDGAIPRQACVLVGDADKPGMRAKDGTAARAARKRARQAVAESLGIPLHTVRAVSRYTSITSDGAIRDEAGNIKGYVELL